MEDVGLGVGAVARRLGVSPSTLRTWNRRYGIGPSRHSEGGHRRYASADIARLELMNRLILDGVPPAEAAHAALTAVEPEQPGPSDGGKAGAGRGTGGRRLSVPGATPATRALARAAMALDAGTVTSIVGEALARDRVERSWNELIAPVLIAVGERHAATGALVQVEHLLAGCVQGALGHVLASAGPPVTTRPVLLASAPEEQHCLPVYALGAALAEEGVAVRVLGARVPADALADAVWQVRPAAVFVWSSLRETGDSAALDGLPQGRPGHRLVLGGPGWTLAAPDPGAARHADRPEGAQAERAGGGLRRGGGGPRHVDSMAAALREIRGAYGRV
ncbi:MerR family transcriptional regulator [Actinomadura gamaensis]|uniref:MerR family transcriptional regulator n=1 Tax=Actinomadura gamaensis TaxID=1763541 RepID=A0ABV9TQS7_9ACTN